MPDETYSVKVNRQEGIVEITGPDKDWIADQLDKLSVVYTQEVGDAPPQDPLRDSGESDEPARAAKTKPTRRRSTATRSSKKTESTVESHLTKDVLRQMHTYFGERPGAEQSHQHRAAVIATFLADELGLEEGLSASDLTAVYRAMGWSPPAKASNVITNATQRNRFFGGMRDGRVHLTPKGEHVGRIESKTTADAA